MKNIFSLFTLALIVVISTSCIEERCEEDRIVRGFDPVIVSPAVWRSSDFICGVPEEVCEASSFYVYENYLFMVENGRGLHIFDNTDSSNPRPITFMDAPGGQGISVRNNILYMNQFVDLVAFDLSNPENPTLIGRTEDVFEPYSVFAEVLADDQFVVDWVPTEEQRVISCSSNNFDQGIFREGNRFFAGSRNELAFSSFANADVASSAPETVGQGGSLARFTIANSTLYAVDNNSLRAFDLSTPAQPALAGTIDLGWGIETIFPYGNQLYIGSETGVHIYGIDDPLAPEHFSTFEHVLACDPVVVNNDLAYVTLWGGRDCGSVGDQLEILDVSNPRAPRSLQVTPMSSSHGLGVAEGKLFLCSQWEGFRVFDLDENGLLGEQLDHVQDITARDVIVLPQDNDLIVLGYYTEGIQQYDYTDEGQLTATSRINVCQ
ncbi:MAG: hypothetical protein AAF597_01200 [Bacteroidota bacterium]